MKATAWLLPLLFLLVYQPRQAPVVLPFVGASSTHRAAAHDVSPPLRSLTPSNTIAEPRAYSWTRIHNGSEPSTIPCTHCGDCLGIDYRPVAVPQSGQ